MPERYIKGTCNSIRLLATPADVYLKPIVMHRLPINPIKPMPSNSNKMNVLEGTVNSGIIQTPTTAEEMP